MRPNGSAGRTSENIVGINIAIEAAEGPRSCSPTENNTAAEEALCAR